jgi:hypothetical protein
MKNKLLYAILMFSLVFSACQEDDYEHIKEGNSVGVSVDAVTIFDSPITIDFTVSNSSVSEIELIGMEVGATKLKVAEGKTSFALSDASLGDYWAIDSSANFSVTTYFDDHESVTEFGIDVVSALSGEVPGEMMVGAITDTTVISIAAETFGGAIESVSVQRKINDGAFAEVKAGSGDEFVFEDEIYGVDFALDDTITYTITATKGKYSEAKSFEIVVVDRVFPAPIAGDLSVASDTIQFAEDVAMSFISGVNARGFASNEMEFVKITPKAEGGFEEFETFSEAMTFVNGATLVKTVANLIVGDVYAYKYTVVEDKMPNKVFYGYLKVTAQSAAELGETDSFSISYRENYIEVK